MKLKDAAKVFIKNEETGNYIFHLRDNTSPLYPNMYGLLGGGIEEGEMPLEAMQRELKEESNIEVYDLEEVGSKVVMNTVNVENGQEEVRNTIFVFLAKTKADIESISVFEGQKVAYFTLEEALALSNLTPAARELITEFRESL